MPLEESIFSVLSAVEAETAALAGVGDQCRVYVGQAKPGAEKPYAVVTLVVAAEVMTHDRGADLEESTVQFSCVADTYLGARALRAAIRFDLRAAGLGDSFISRSGFSEAVDTHLMHLDVTFWNAPAEPA